MNRKIIIVIMVSFLLLLTIYAGSSIAGGDKNQNQHDGEPVGEPNDQSNGEVPDPWLHRNEEPKRAGTNDN